MLQDATAGIECHSFVGSERISDNMSDDVWGLENPLVCQIGSDYESDEDAYMLDISNLDDSLIFS